MTEKCLEPTIKLGLMPPLTGIVGLYGEDICREAQIGCKEINEPGVILRNKYAIAIEDDGRPQESAYVTVIFN